MALAPSRIHPTLKIALDDGSVEDEAAAEDLFRTYVLQVDLQSGAPDGRADEAALLTILNAAPRAFLGGVRVRIDRDVELTSPWTRGQRLSDVVARFGSELVTTLDHGHPTLVIGAAPERFPTDGICLTVTYRGWSGGVLSTPQMMLPAGYVFPPAAIAAASVAMAEAFQRVRGGDARAARRDIGLSLWRPGIDWKSPEAFGPSSDLTFPSPIHLAGLGHLGQACLWALGFFDYDAMPCVYLQDDDAVAPENLPTSMLVGKDDLGLLKTRACATKMEAIGFPTRLLERRLDENQRRGRLEPQVLLSGFDNPIGRSLLSNTGFDLIVDLGIGAGHRDFMDMRLYSFPGARRSEEIFPTQGPDPVDEYLLKQPAYVKLHAETQDRCGVINVAGRAVGACFVGAFTAAVGIAELGRYYNDDRRFEVVDISLKNVARASAAVVDGWAGPENLGYCAVN